MNLRFLPWSFALALLVGCSTVSAPHVQRNGNLSPSADAGQAADNFNSLDPVVGYGVGVRYRSPVGPLRVDIAYGQEVKSWRLHLSIGIAL